VEPVTASVPEPLRLIARPGDGGGAVARELPVVESVLRKLAVAFEVALAPGPGDAEREARRALASGRRKLVAIGADRTVREVVAGMMAAPEGSARPELAVLAGGSGCDFVRTFGLPEDTSAAAARLPDSVAYPIDVARISVRDPSGGERVTHFAGIAEAGLSGLVQRRADRAVERRPARARRRAYFVAFWRTMARYAAPTMRVDVAARTFRGRAHNVVVGNCQFAREGIRVSPRSFPGDGLFEVLVYHGPKSDAFTLLPRMFRGEQVPHPNIEELRGRRIRVEADPPQWVQADGEALGLTPMVVELIPEAITLRV
jgi:YegS/Rv2252/BmrU family lipid kinase